MWDCLRNGIRYLMYPLVNIQKLWKITVFNGKTHYKWSIFHSYVSLPEGTKLGILGMY